MFVKCKNCESSFSVSDEKVKGKKFGFDCPKCKHKNIFDYRLENKQDHDATGKNHEDDFIPEDSEFGNDSIPLKKETDEFDFGTDFGTDEISNNTEIEASDDDFAGELPELDDEQEEFDSNNINEMSVEENDYIEDEEIEPEFDMSILDKQEYQLNKPQSDDLLDLNSESLDDDKDIDDDFGMPDENLAIDLNSLDIDLDNDENIAAGESLEDDFLTDDFQIEENNNDSLTLDDYQPEENDELEILPQKEINKNVSDEDITIDIEHLDIDLEDDDTESAGEEPELDDFDNNVMTSEENSFDETSDLGSSDDLTLDLQTLDVDLDVEDNYHNSEKLDNDEQEDNLRLTIHDAGINLDDYETSDDTIKIQNNEDDEEIDLKLSISEISPDLNIDDLSTEVEEAEEHPKSKNFSNIPLTESFSEDDLPEIDIEKMDDSELTIPSRSSKHIDLDFLDINPVETITDEPDDFGVAGSGYISFSIDYSLRYAKMRALLRLLLIYHLTFIPHFITLLLYSLVGLVLGFFNNIIILLSGHAEKDFVLYNEKTIRYFAGILASVTDIVEDKPPFAGAKNIDYPLQLKTHPPIKHSRILALMRLSIVGILLIMLPHIILTCVLTIAAFVFSLIGLLVLAFKGKWPAFLFDFMVRYFRYLLNIISYTTGIIDTYPSFRFE